MTVSFEKAQALKAANIAPPTVSVGQFWYAVEEAAQDTRRIIVFGADGDDCDLILFSPIIGSNKYAHSARAASIQKHGFWAPTIIDIFPHLPINTTYKLWGHRAELIGGKDGLHCVGVPYVDECGEPSKKDFVNKTNPHDAAADALLWWMEYQKDG